MPAEGEPGTLTHLFDKSAVPESRRKKRKTLPAEDMSEEEPEHEEPKPFDKEEEELLDALNSEEFLRPDYPGPPLGPAPPPSRASTSASGASGVSDTEVGALATSALAKKIASHANYHCTDQFVNEAMAMYKSATREEKHKLLEQFEGDKSCRWIVHLKESHKSENLHHPRLSTGG